MEARAVLFLQGKKPGSKVPAFLGIGPVVCVPAARLKTPSDAGA